MKPLHKALAGLGAILVLAAGVAAQHEGLRLHAYRDVGGVPTICYGDTHGVAMGQVATVAECKQWLAQQMRVAVDGVEHCVKRPMTPQQEAAFGDLAYNVGVSRFCSSSVARKFNAGDTQGACDALLLYVKADGKVLKGLQRRRAQERALCLQPATR